MESAIAILKSLDQFKTLITETDDELVLNEYSDAQIVITPDDHQFLNVVISGQVLLILDENLFKRVMNEIKDP